MVDGPVSAEVTATTYDRMLAEGRRLAEIAPNVCVKLPLIWDGLKACRTLTGEGIQVNVTLCFSAAQALLAAKAGATFVSPFVGRLDDIAHDGMALIGDIVEIFGNYRDTLATEVLVASVRHPGHVVEAARLGADVATMPAKILHQLASIRSPKRGWRRFSRTGRRPGRGSSTERTRDRRRCTGAVMQRSWLCSRGHGCCRRPLVRDSFSNLAAIDELDAAGGVMDKR